MAKQLNIRSDEAYERARRIAKRMGTTTTEVVVRALRRYDPDPVVLPSFEDLTPEQKRDYEHFRELARRARKEMENGPTFEVEDLYGDDGLPG